MNDERFKIFSGTANPVLAEAICKHLDVPLGRAMLGRFSDGEIYFQILENVRGADVFVVQPCHYPVDNHLLELLLMIDAFKRASAWRITAVLPYYCYARQDRKDKPRVPISAKLVADLLETAGASRALTLDLHAPQIQGYFDVPVDHLFASPVLVEYFRHLNLPDLTVVSPDAGGVERARFFAKKLDAPLAIVDKRRVDVDVSEVMNLIGIANQGSGRHGFDSTQSSGPGLEEDSRAQRSGLAGARYSFDSRGILDQRIVHLSFVATKLKVSSLRTGFRVCTYKL